MKMLKPLKIKNSNIKFKNVNFAYEIEEKKL